MNSFTFECHHYLNIMKFFTNKPTCLEKKNMYRHPNESAMFLLKSDRILSPKNHANKESNYYYQKSQKKKQGEELIIPRTFKKQKQIVEVLFEKGLPSRLQNYSHRMKTSMNYRSFEKQFIDESKELYYGIVSNQQGNSFQMNSGGCNSSTKASTPTHSESEDTLQSYSSGNGLYIGTYKNPPKKYSTDLSSTEEYHIDPKPKRKPFCSPEEKKKFIDDYTKKLKTEMCKNWIISGTCKFGEKCSFAHGQGQLQGKIHLHPNFKTKPCKKFFMKGVCTYGSRCQYIHTVTELIAKGHEDFLKQVYPQKKCFSIIERLSSLKKSLNINKRLPFFIQMAQKGVIIKEKLKLRPLKEQQKYCPETQELCNQDNPSPVRSKEEIELVPTEQNVIKEFCKDYFHL